jgi:hypothetical protein
MTFPHMLRKETIDMMLTEPPSLLEQAREFTDLLFELRALRMDHQADFPIKTLDLQATTDVESGLYRVAQTDKFVCCLERPSNFAAPTEHEEPIRLIAHLNDDPHLFVVFSKTQSTSMLALFPDVQVSWHALAEYNAPKDLWPWIVAAREEIIQWTSTIMSAECKKDISCTVGKQLQELTQLVLEREAICPGSGLIELTGLFAEVMKEHLKETRVTLKRSSVNRLMQVMLNNLEAGNG